MIVDFENYINKRNFPCIMAKSILRAGNIHYFVLDLGSVSYEFSLYSTLLKIYKFVSKYKASIKKTNFSFVVLFKNAPKDFKTFELFFWKFLEDLHRKDRVFHQYSSEVSSDIHSKNFSYSIKKMAFFIILLHPSSPRRVRRFGPAIVFNPHEQFMKLREDNKFLKIRNIIRDRVAKICIDDLKTLNDYGSASEVLQYSGSKYDSINDINLCI